MNPFQSLRDYEILVYTLKQRFPSVQRSTLVVVQRGKRIATLQGEITFTQGYRITLKERLSLDEGPVVIEDYGYELWHEGDKIAWYDSGDRRIAKGMTVSCVSRLFACLTLQKP